MELVNILAELYAAKYTSTEDTLLQRLAADTLADHPQSHMLSGHVQGTFLSLISKLKQPRRILEVGTFTGYSALCLASGLPPSGKLHTIELRPEETSTAQQYFQVSRYRDQIIQHTGDAKKIIPSLDETWDLVFIDADKMGYIEYYELILPKVKQNGIVIADNVLFHGQVLEKPVTGKNAKAIEAFNTHVSNDGRVEQVLLTVRDGLLIIRKK